MPRKTQHTNHNDYGHRHESDAANQCEEIDVSCNGTDSYGKLSKNESRFNVHKSQRTKETIKFTFNAILHCIRIMEPDDLRRRSNNLAQTDLTSDPLEMVCYACDMTAFCFRGINACVQLLDGNR